MSHFAKINKDNIVIELIVAEKTFINSGLVGDEFNWVQCSYNSNFRNKYPGIGDVWDKNKDRFISPQPYDSWAFNETTLKWEAPTPYPENTTSSWSEESQVWVDNGDDIGLEE